MRQPGGVSARLSRLAPDQLVAATAPSGPVLCVAPAGSGKTTTLVARIAWLVDQGADPATITALTFNKRAADELRDRLANALDEIQVPGGSIRVRTFHALGREILASADAAVEPLIDRDDVLREITPDADLATRRRLDTAFSRLKLDLRVTADEIAADPDAGPVGRAFVAYESALAERAGLDFDDFVARALRLLEDRDDVTAEWRARCSNLLVDEAQDLDRSQLDLALLLAAPSNRIFLVGDDDQSIYGWRLADVRRVLSLAAALPGLRRIDLVTNYRCPRPVVTRAVRLIARNRERFAKHIVPRRDAPGLIHLAADDRDDAERIEAILSSVTLDAAETMAILARTNRELLPAIVVAVVLDRAFRPPAAALLVDDPRVDVWLSNVASDNRDQEPLLVRLEALRREIGHAGERRDVGDAISDDALLGSIMSWASAYRTLPEFRNAIAELRCRVHELSRDDAPLTLATVHGTKGLEWDHVAVLGMDVGRFPSRRAVAESAEPIRALEEERRLAYVAWTRARRTLILSYDPEAPSQFLLEAFTDAELRRRGTAS